MSITAANSNNASESKALGDYNEYVTVMVGDQIFGSHRPRARRLHCERRDRGALASREIMGLLNLRGRVVTAMCLRRRLGLPDAAEGREMAVGLEHQGESRSSRRPGRRGREAVRRHPRAEPGSHGPALGPIEPRRPSARRQAVDHLDVDAVLALDAEARAAYWEQTPVYRALPRCRR